MAVEVQDKKNSSEVGGSVSYAMLIDGKVISEALEIVSIDIHQEINIVTRATVVIVDGDPDTKDFKISSGNQFLPGKKIEISLGYESTNTVVFKGIIVSNSQKANNDCAILTLECKDETVKMTLDKNSSHYDKTSSSDIADSFFDKYGFKNKNITPATLSHAQLVQFHNSDWDFMISKLDASNLMCILNNGEIIIREITAKPEVSEDELVLFEFRDNILEFNAELDSRSQAEKVTVISWNYTTQQLENENGEPVQLDKKNSSVNEIGKGQKTTIIAPGKKDTEEQKKLADTKIIRQALAKIKGKLKYFGKVEKPVIAGDFVKLSGFGENFDGVIFVSAINHEFSDGDWTTTASLGWDNKFFAEQINPTHETSSSGQLSTIQGLQTGIITDIIDSDGDFRVKLKLPLVNNEQEGVFARLATLDAGNNRGTFFMPEINDEVVVGFINNDPNQPIVLGMLHSSKNAAPLAQEKSNNKKGLVSRSEIKIIIDDGEKSVTIETPGGHIINMNDTEQTVFLKDSSGNKITLEPSGITVESASVLNLKAATSISMTAPSISIKADADIKVEGGIGTVSSSGIMSIKGSIVNIN